MGLDLRLLPRVRAGRADHRHRRDVRRGRTAFDEAWRIFLSKRTEADFQAWRDARDWTERKYAMWARGERLPSQKPSSLMTCPCGEVFDSHRLECTVIHVPHIGAVTAARQRS